MQILKGMTRVLCCGDVHGRFSQLIKKVGTVNKKSGPFDILFCVGEFFGLSDEDNQKVINGELEFPVPTYILGPCCPSTSALYPDESVEFSSNLTYLGKRGLLNTASGLQIAYLSGTEGSSINQFQFTYDDVQDLLIPVKTQAGFIGIDILVTSMWPAEVWKHAHNTPCKEVEGSPLIARLASGLRPRYHFAGMGVHYEREPYRNHRVLLEPAQHTTRFIGLASVDNEEKQKWLYAFNLQPMRKMSRDELTAQPPNSSEFPYMEILQDFIAKEAVMILLKKDLPLHVGFVYQTLMLKNILLWQLATPVMLLCLKVHLLTITYDSQYILTYVFAIEIVALIYIFNFFYYYLFNSSYRETVFHPGNTTMAETHLLRSTGLHSQSFTEEHWTSEITSFVATAPPKFIQVIKAYRVLSTDTPTLVVEVASDPPAIFEWFCNDKPVLQDRHQFHARHGLNITTLTIDHPEQGVYKCTARNPAGLSTSYGYISVNCLFIINYRCLIKNNSIPSRQMRPPVAPGEHISRNMMSVSHHLGSNGQDGHEMLTTHQMVNVYEVNYSQRSSSVPRGVRHLERHIEVPQSPESRELEHHRAGNSSISPFKIKNTPIRENKDLPKSPSITEKLPLTLRIGQNQPLVLKVSADAIPEANFMWLINNFELKPNANVSINKPGLNQSEICLRKTLPGKYSVFARNTLGQDCCSCKVIVDYDESIKEDQQEAPTLLKKLPKETLHTSGMETPLSITVLGLAPFIFRWFINGTEVEKDEFQTIVDRNKSVLVLKRALKEGTIIAAEAKNKYGVIRSQTIIKNAENQAEATEESQVSSKVFLSKKAPVFVKCLEDIVLSVGGTLLCGVGIDKNCDPCEFEWSINSVQIIDTESRITIDSTTHESIVCINEISMLATGHLTVVAKNNYGSSVSSALLSVTQRRDEPFEMVPPNLPEESAPKIVEPLHSVSFIDGQPMVLRCRIVANPSAVIVWSKDDINVDEWVINKDVTTQGLSYYKDTEEASASESCSVGLDDLEMDRTKIIFPPKFIENLTPETDAITELGYIRLVCKVKSETPLDVTWWMNNTELHQNEKYDIYQFSDGTQILTIHGATNNDNGVYTCKAESGYGLSTSSCEVDVPEKKQYDELIKENITMCTRTIQGDSDWTSISIIEPKLDATVLIEPNKEDVSGTTEIKKHEEEFKLLVKVADSVASTLVANVFINAVKEAVKKIVEESEEESETVVDMECPPRFDTSIEEYVATQNDSIKISTTVSGYPTPFIEWYFGENKIIVTEKISMSYENGFAALNFKEIQPHQEGTYYCHATNIHGTTVLSCKLRVVSEKKGDNIRFSLAKYDKHDAQQEVVTNVFVHSKENDMEQIINIASSNKDIQKANFMALSQPVRNLESINGREEKKSVRDIHADKEVLNMEESNEDNAIVSFPTQEGQIIPLLKIEEEETQNIVLTPLPFGQDPSSTQLTTTSSTVILDKEEDSGRRSVTMPYEEKVKVIEDRLKTASSLDISPQEAVNMIMNTVIALKEQHITDETTNVDIRNPPAKFDHVVTVVEPEVVQFCLHLSASTTPSFKFIDLETILQKPSTSSDTNTLLASTKKRSANAEYRIVVLEGVSKSFQNAITWSLKKVQKLTSETPENAAYANIEVIKPSETNEKVMKIVDTEKMIPDLLQVAATASKLKFFSIQMIIQIYVKLENVTISLVRHGDTAHQQLIIEYEGAVEEEETNLNVSHLIYHRLDEESKEQVWSRRSRYSDRDEGNIVAVFVEVDACCPDQSVEIVASVNTPTEAKAANDDESSPELLDASESVTESSSAIGIQAPKFFRKLIDNQALVGNSVQFKCIVSGTPTPDVVWSVDGDIIEPNQEYDLVYEDGVCILRIHETLPEDEGEYCCEAINSAGKAITKCFLKVIKKEPRTPRHFIEHAPSLTELIDEEEQHSFDSFEWEERKANALFGAEESLDSLFESPNRLVISNSDFDVSKAINYNEDMEETNAFHKYFETAETVVNVTELEQFTSVHGLFHACIPTNYPVNVLSTNPRNNIINNNDLWKEIFNDPFSKELEDHSFEHIENSFYEPRTPLLPQKLFYRGQEIGISVTEVKKEQAQVNEKGEVEIAMKTCLETSLEFHAPVNAFSVPKKNVILKESKEIEETKTLLVPITSPDKCFIESFNIDQSDELSISNQLNSISLPERPVIHQNLEFIDKVKEIERIARQVDQELCHLSGNTSGNELSGDAQEIEKAIFKISDQLVLQNPVSEAQAEASEELLRTTLADMILNPTRTAEEEIELMKRPIRLLRRKLSDIENSLLEDVEVTNITETAQGTSIRTTSSDTPATIMTPPLKKRVPSAEYLRMTPLTSTIKDQLTCLEEMINEHLNSESPSVSEDITSGSKVQRVRSTKKRELHDLFVQINNEINTIKSFCKSKLSKKGSDAVMNVLHKVRTHVTSIVNVMSLTKKKRHKVATKDRANTEIRYHFKCPEAREKVEGIMVFKRSSMESSLANQSSTALSTSDDTWRYSTELKTSSSDKRLSNVSLQPVTEKIGVEMEANAIAEQIPFPPPRKRRTMSSEPAVCEPPVPPPRRMKLESHEKEVISDCSKDAETMELLESISEEPFAPPTKPKRSFTGDSLEALLQFSNELAKTEQGMTQHEMEISLLNELKKISVSKSKCKQENYDLIIVSDTIMEDNLIAFETRNDVIEVHYEGTYATIAFCKETALKVELEIPLCTLTTILFHIPVDDGSSVQMVCEESDYATDTDTSCLLKGTVQFFNRYSPLDPNRRSNYLKEEVEENTEDIVVNIELKSVNSEGDIGSLGSLNLCGMVIYDSHCDKKLEKTEEQISQKNVYLSTIMERSSDMTSVHTDSSDAKIKYTSDETIHMVMEENLLSQMESSVKTDDDVDRRINSRNTIRETDILSDESAIIEIEQSVTDYVEETFSYTRLSARRKLLAIISYEIRQAASATVYSDNTFDVIIEQEPEILGVNIKVIEDQVDFTSLTILSDYDCDYFDMLEPQRVFDDYTENSSLEDVEGESKTGISVSIIARSLHDGIYASLEEIPWGEVQMTVNEVDNMGRSIEDESKLNSVQFSVTVSESNADEKKSLRSQTSFNQSQNSISEIENTISTGSINIPSYVIKIGSTATITCELNNYLPPKSHIEWYKGKYHLERKAGKLDRISHDLLEVLIINNVQMTDNDLYSLKVNDDIFPVAYLIVEGQSSEEINAVIVTPPQTQFVMEGQPTVLMVQAKNTIQPVYWLKDRNPLQENNRLHFEITEGGWNKVILLETHLSDQGTYYAVLGEQSIAITLVLEHVINGLKHYLVIHDTSSSDSGLYSVSISNTEFRVAHLSVNDLATSIQAVDLIEETCVPVGAVATINCETMTEEKQIEWNKDRSPIEVAHRGPAMGNCRFLIEDSEDGHYHSLTVLSVDSEDAGEYGVIIDGVYTVVTKIKVIDSEVISQEPVQKREMDISLNLSSAKDGTDVNIAEQILLNATTTSIRKEIQKVYDIPIVSSDDVPFPSFITTKSSSTEGLQQVTTTEDGFEVIRSPNSIGSETTKFSISIQNNNTSVVVTPDFHVTENTLLPFDEENDIIMNTKINVKSNDHSEDEVLNVDITENRNDEELRAKIINEATLQAAESIAIEIIENVFTDTMSNPAAWNVAESLEQPFKISSYLERKMCNEIVESTPVSSDEDFEKVDILSDISSDIITPLENEMSKKTFEFDENRKQFSAYKKIQEPNTLGDEQLIEGELDANRTEYTPTEKQKRPYNHDSCSVLSSSRTSSRKSTSPEIEIVTNSDIEEIEQVKDVLLQQANLNGNMHENCQLETDYNKSKLENNHSEKVLIDEKATNIKVYNSENITVILELYNDYLQLSAEKTVKHGRRCKLTTFLTFDQLNQDIPMQDVNVSFDFFRGIVLESTEVNVSQIMYEDDGFRKVHSQIIVNENEQQRLRPALLNRKGPIFLYDNDRPHVSQMTLQKLNELAYESLPYPDHSSDFSPTDYHFFKHIDNILQEDYKLIEDSPTKYVGKKEFMRTGYKKRTPISYRNDEHILTMSGQQNRKHETEVATNFDQNLEIDNSKGEYDEQRPEFILPLMDGTFSGDSCTLKCIIAANPIIRLDWTVNGRPIQNDQNHELIFDDGIGILRIKNINEDFVDVTCSTLNNKGEATTCCRLKRIDFLEFTQLTDTDEKPFFLFPLKDIVTDINEVRLKCIVIGHPTPSLEWYRNGEKIDTEYIYEDGVALINIRDISKNDSIITCLATNRKGIAESCCIVRNESIDNNISKDRTAPPHFLRSLTDTITDSDSISLTVLITSVPDADVEWAENGIAVSDKLKKDLN
uniref:Ig-like domain-containing protein n=1 Tax=Heterorhabditis bacteriophora TaxID=37862 RepID=A0A1I7WAP6_HETBA